MLEAVPRGRRRAGLGPAARLARPAHPLRRRAGAMSRCPPTEPLPERYVDTAPFDPQDVERLTPEQERFYTASQWRLMWWKFRRHRLAVVSAGILLLFYCSTLVERDHRPLRPAHPQRRAHPRPAAAASTCSTRAASSARSSTAEADARHGDAEARLQPRTPSKVQPLRFFCQRRPLQVLGPARGQLPPRLPGRGRHAVPDRHRPARPRRVLAHPPRRPHLAHRRPARHRRELRAGHRARRHLGLLRRLDRQRDPAPDRDHPLASR